MVSKMPIPDCNRTHLAEPEIDNALEELHGITTTILNATPTLVNKGNETKPPEPFPCPGNL